MTAAILERIGYPLTALITTNCRLSLFGRKVIFPLMVVILPLLLAITMRVVFYFFPPPLGAEETNPYFMYSILATALYLQFIVPLLALLKGMSILTEEVEEGTLIFLFLRPVPRTVIILGKFLAAIIATSILLIFSLWSVFFVISSLPDAEMILGDLPILLKDTWILCLGVAAYGAVMMLVGTYFKHPLMVGIFLLFVWDAFAAFIPGAAHRFTIKHYLQSIFPHPRTEKGLDALLSEHPPDTYFRSVSTLILIIAACILLSTFILKHKQYGSAQETG